MGIVSPLTHFKECEPFLLIALLIFIKAFRRTDNNHIRLKDATHFVNVGRSHIFI